MKKESKGAFSVAIMWTICAVMWWINSLRSGGLMWLCAGLWTLGAVIWWARWLKARKMEQNSDITGGNENE